MQVIAGIALFAVLGGLLYALWAVIRRSRRRTRRFDALRYGPIVATSTPVVVRHNRKATTAAALGSACFLALGVQIMRTGSPILFAVIFGAVIIAIAASALVKLVRATLQDEPVLVADGDGFSTPSSGRIPWETVEQVRMNEWRDDSGSSRYDMTFELAPEAGREDIEIDLMMLSMSWVDVAGAVQSRLGRRLTIGRGSIFDGVHQRRSSTRRVES